MAKVVYLVCSICLLIIGLIFLLVSIGTVEPIEYGLVYNSFSKKVDLENTYQGGWYLIGPFSSFFTFPATYINIDFTEFPGAQRKPLEKVKDSTGQDMKFSFSLQLKLNLD